MARAAKVRWEPVANAWRSDVGPRSAVSGRRVAVYFREIPNTPRGRRAAEGALADYLRGREARERAAAEEAGNPTLDAVAEAYLRDLRRLVGEGELAERTLATHKERLAALADWRGPDGVRTGDRPARAVTAADGARWLRALKDAGHSPQYRKGLLASARAMTAWAARSDPSQGRAPLIAADPFRDLRAPRVPRGSRRYVTRAEMAAFLRSAWRQVNAWTPIHGRCSGCVRARRRGARCRRQHSRAAALDRTTLLLARCQFHCGTRPGELVAALWTDWEPRAWADPATGAWWGLVTLPPGRHKTGRKAEEDRLIPVRPALARAIERHRASPHAHPAAVFSRLARPGRRADGAATAPWASVAELGGRIRAWRKAAIASGALAEEPGRPLILYAMRHSWYTRATGAGGLTADQAGAVGSTGERVVRDTYVRRRLASVMRSAAQVDRAARAGGD